MRTVGPAAQAATDHRLPFPLQPPKMPQRGTLSFVAPASALLTVGTEGGLHLFVKAWVAQYPPMLPGGELSGGRGGSAPRR